MKFMVLSAVFRLISLLPVRLQRWLSRPLGSLSWHLSGTKRRSTLKNLAACYPGMPEPDREKLGRASMRNYVLLGLETGMSWYWSHQRVLRLFDDPVGVEHMDNALAAGNGAIMLVPHLGAWEVMNLWLVPRYRNVALYKPGRYPEFEEKLLRKRERFGGKMAPTTRAGLKVIVRYLKSGRAAIVLPDQDPSEGQGRFAPFFEIPALTGVLASRLAQQTGCRAVFTVGKRVAGGRFQVHFQPVEEAFYSPDMDTSLAALNRGVERCIDIDPEQYLWAYKRFKSRPEGEPPFY